MPEPDIDEYIAGLTAKHAGGNEGPVGPRQKAYLAKLLLSQGRNSDALPLLQDATDEARRLRAEGGEEAKFLWTGFLCDVGALLASTLDYSNDEAAAERIYIELLSLQPNGAFIGDWAIFLHRKKKDHAQAEAFYLRSIELFPGQSSIHLKYAAFLRHVHKDLKRADVQYRLAIEANKKNPEAIGSYASFLHGVLGKIDLAGEFYEEALRLDAFHANNLCNFGLYLSEERGNYGRAETLYQRALQHSPSHANSLYNYAVMLDTHCQRKAEAEALYKRVVDDVEPRHAFALYNLAVLLEDKVAQADRQEDAARRAAGQQAPGPDPTLAQARMARRQEVCSLYRRAVECDEKDAVTTADLGRYLLTRMDDIDGAEAALFRALQLDSENVVAVYNLALLMHKHRADFDAAEKLLSTLTRKQGHKHAAAMQQLARVYLDKYKASADQREFEACLRTYEKTIDLLASGDPALCMIEYLRAVTEHGSNRQKTRAISFIDGALTRPMARESDIRTMVASMRRLQEGSKMGPV